MWIIPRNLPTSHSVQGTEESTSDSIERLAELFAQSLMWRSKPFQSSTWLKRLKRVSWIQPLSSQTLKPFLGDSIVTEWTSSLGASLVNHLARPDEEPEMKTQDTFGPISSKESESWEDLPLFSLRTLKGLSQANLKEQVGEIARERRFCSMSSVSWRDWVTTQRRACSRRVNAAQLTKGKECSFLVSEMISKQGGIASLNQESNDGLKQLIQEEKDQKDIYGNPRESFWATPTTRDFYDKKLTKPLPTRKDGQKRLDLLPRQVFHQEGYQGIYNPRWVETMMGLPIGWTMPSCMNPVTVELMSSECLEMELSLIQQREHSKSCSIG